MGLFTKYCAVCGKRVEKGSDIVRFGKHFDSEVHAEQYTQELEKDDKVLPKSQRTKVMVAVAN